MKEFADLMKNVIELWDKIDTLETEKIKIINIKKVAVAENDIEQRRR